MPTFPFVIDLTTFTLTDGFTIQGDAAGDQAGRSVASAGDVNGDGFDDLIVGVPFGDDGGAYAGEAYVIFGKAGGFGNIDLTSLTSAGFIIQGDVAGDFAGISVASAGDINGDGFDDLIVGAPSGDNGGANAGEAYVIFGHSGGFTNIDLTGLTAAQGFIIQGDAAGDTAAFSVASAGDINGDGFDDLIVGASNGDNGGIDAGEAYVIFGKASGFTNIDLTSLTVAQGFIIQGDVAGDAAGLSVASAGDVNGDGFDDLIVGAHGGDNGGSYAGEAYVLFGHSGGFTNIDLAGLTAAQGFIIQGDAAYDQAGNSVASAGDVNGDGFDDLIVGAWRGDNGGGNAGEAYVIFGKSGGFGNIDLTNFSIPNADGFIIQGDAAYDNAGFSVAAAGDVNGDGFGDLIVGAPHGDNGGAEAGEAYVIFGHSGGFTNIDLTSLTAAQGFIIQGDAAGDTAGGSVAAAGDVNGDGFDDLIVGAIGGDNGGDAAGEAYVIYGRGDNAGIFTPGHDTVDLNAFDLTLFTLAETTDALPGNDVVILSATQNIGTPFAGNIGNDFITGSANSDSIDGGVDNDILIGGGGADLLAGSAGNDVFRFTAGDLIVTEIIDGGADTDRLEFRSGVHSLIGATLTSIEQIALTGTGATTVTLANAAQALLFTSSAGSNDTVIFNGDLTPTQLEAMAAAGIEHVQFVSNGNAVTANYTAGVLREIILQDIPVNNDVWSTVTHTRDAAGVLTSLQTLFDNSIDEVISFVGGLKTTVEKTDTAGGVDFTWASQAFIYNAAGTQLASMLQTEDNGDERYHIYTGGALTFYEFTDTSGSSSNIASFAIEYDVSGPATGYQTVFDNGTIAATSLTNGVRYVYVQYDTSNIDSNYDTFQQNFAANGIDVTDQIYTHDNGSTTATNFVAGGSMTGTAANNSMTGAVGADTFIFSPTGGGGNDYIANFESGVDHIDLAAYGFTSFAQVEALTVANGPNGVYLTFSGSNHLAVNGLSLANMTADDFLL